MVLFLAVWFGFVPVQVTTIITKNAINKNNKASATSTTKSKKVKTTTRTTTLKKMTQRKQLQGQKCLKK